MTTLPKPPNDPPPVVFGSKTAGKPVTAKLAPWPRQEKVRELADVLDKLYSDAEAMVDLDEQLGAASDDAARGRIIEKVEMITERIEKICRRLGFEVGDLQKLWKECVPECWWSKDGGPSRIQVTKMVILLIGSFPTSKIPEPEIFVPALVEDVMEFEPSFVEMESTCRNLRTKKRFIPAISEVIEELEQQQKLWARRSSTMSIIENFFDELRAETVQAKIEGKHSLMIEDRQKVPMTPVETLDIVKDEDDF